MSKFKLGAWFHRAGKLLRGRTFTAAGLAAVSYTHLTLPTIA